MKLWIGCICIAIALVIGITALSIKLVHMKKEKYKSMRNLGKFPAHIGVIKSAGHPDDDEYDSLKYRDHRYERQRVRYHAPNKIYQQS